MARFVAGFPLGRLLVVGGLITIGWLWGMFFAAPGAAASTAGTPSVLPSHNIAGPVLADRLSAANSAGSLVSSTGIGAKAGSGDFPTASKNASVNAEAMAGRMVDGLTSQSKPGFPSPSTADHAPGDRGLAPQPGGGSILFGDVARSLFEPRFTALPAPMAAVVPPVVRTAADDPSFSPD